ncbi:MAG: hypothetical protein BM562_10930 [Alphaproteobacteria bacterium MedPE-SWcel]|nr:MAG: hypothetical protein BM562_10930 [Alphaproteobacteria bacterium MedPE-SWcel]
MIDLHAAFGEDIAAFKSLAKDVGLSSKAKALQATLQVGCGGDVLRFRDFCQGFSDEDSRLHLKTLVDVGGLGDAPEVFGALIATGCAGNPAALIRLCQSMDCPGAMTGLKLALTDGGLADGCSAIWSGRGARRMGLASSP